MTVLDFLPSMLIIASEGISLSSKICKIMISDFNGFVNSMALFSALSDNSDPSCGTKIFCVKTSLP